MRLPPASDHVDVVVALFSTFLSKAIFLPLGEKVASNSRPACGIRSDVSCVCRRTRITNRSGSPLARSPLKAIFSPFGDTSG